MPHIVLDLPEQKPGIEAAVLKQFTDIQRQLMGFLKVQQEAAQSMRADLLSTLRTQQEELTGALESLIKAVQTRPMPQDHSDQLASAIRDLKQAIHQKPSPPTLRSEQPRGSLMAPKVTVSMPPALLSRLDSLETSLLQGMRRSRSRTFGSNY